MMQYFAEQLGGGGHRARSGSSRMGAGMSGRQSCMGRAPARADDVDWARYAQSRRTSR
jgi:hypothetical protein